MDILFEVSAFSSYHSAPREDRLEQINHIFRFLKKKPKLTLYFDPQEPNIDPLWLNGESVDVFKDQYVVVVPVSRPYAMSEL